MWVSGTCPLVQNTSSGWPIGVVALELYRQPVSSEWHSHIANITMQPRNGSSCSSEKNEIRNVLIRKLRGVHSNISEFLAWCNVPLLNTSALIFNVGHTAEPVLDYVSRRLPRTLSIKENIDKFESPEMLEFGLRTVSSFNDIEPEILMGVTRGLIWLHKNDIVHGDLRCENIIVENDKAILVNYGNTLYFYRSYKISLTSVYAILGLYTSVFAKAEDITIAKDIYDLATCFREVRFSASNNSSWSPESLTFGKILMGKPTCDDSLTKHFQNDVSRSELQMDSLRSEYMRREQLSKIWSIMRKCWSDDMNVRPSAEDVLTSLISTKHSINHWQHVTEADMQMALNQYKDLGIEDTRPYNTKYNLNNIYEDTGKVLQQALAFRKPLSLLPTAWNLGSESTLECLQMHSMYFTEMEFNEIRSASRRKHPREDTEIEAPRKNMRWKG
ncbi:hypothetical protein SCHPADRAFT_893408 [Schizopora paradoxa]|uniref:Protein kinase domain-containing protein n=1 Tax=Schizopora paradoxa TaxID=27342 RepID=A0A0H2RB82_9AGAM|nr:hypothetical protein SCHPADRAFT_893408 [Schizopora paradoxa]